MKTPFEKIVDINAVGRADNSVGIGELFSLAEAERAAHAPENGARTLLLAVDVQRDFMDGGVLGVNGALDDVRRLTRFMYDNMENITEIAVTMDTHAPQQIFHPCWWRGEDGAAPAPFTVITKDDLDLGRWTPLFEPKESAAYLEYLGAAGKKRLCIWPYHCIAGTTGAALENQFSNMAHFFSIVKGVSVKKIIKGTLPATEFYGAVRPEYSPNGLYTNDALLDVIKSCSRVVIAGEAKDYCVYETVRQIFEELENEPQKPEIFILEDCTSSIQSPEEAAALYSGLAEKYAFHLVKSTDKFL